MPKIKPQKRYCLVAALKDNKAIKKDITKLKSYNHLFEKLISYDNLYKAIQKSSKRKKNRKDVKRVLKNPDLYIKKIQTLLISQSYKIPNHKATIIWDKNSKKERLLIVPKYVYEQILQHAIVQVLMPIFMNGMYTYSCGSIPNRGGHYGKRYLERYIKRNNNNNIKYILKLDAYHYYQSIDINILKEKLRRKIHDEKMLYCIFLVLDSNIAEIDGKNVNMGLPIGFYTSQWFANWFLQDFDHTVKEKYKIKCYVRYVDDMIFFDKNKKHLHKVFNDIKERFKKLNLKVKKNWQVYKFNYIKNEKEIGRDLDFMGFRFFRNKTTLRKSILLNATRKAKRISKKELTTVYDAQQIISYIGYFKHTDTFNIFKEKILKVVNLETCKKIISNKTKARGKQ